MQDSPQHLDSAMLARRVPAFVRSLGWVGVISPKIRGLLQDIGVAQVFRLDTARQNVEPVDCVVLPEVAAAVLPEVQLALNGASLAICAFDSAAALAEIQSHFDSAELDLLAVSEVSGGVIGTFVRRDFDPVDFARHLADIHMPNRAAAVIDWILGLVPVSDDVRAVLAVEKLRCYKISAELAGIRPSHHLLFQAQKEFHIAVHSWPRRSSIYREHAAIWHRFNNDDYAARLLRSVAHVAPDPQTTEHLRSLCSAKTPQPGDETCPQWSGRPVRVLVLTHSRSDYGMDSLYDGLCQVLGPDNVVEYPWKPTLHGRDREATLNYPCFFDYPGDPIPIDELERRLRAGQFDLVVFADFVDRSNREDVVRLLAAAKDLPIVAYDPWDDGSATQDSATRYLGNRRIHSYFKREMLACLDYGPNAHPLPFGYPDRHVPHEVSLDRSVDLFWAGKRLFGTRALYLDRLSELLGRPLDRQMSQDEYRTQIGHARVGLSLFGFGFDTVRYWELAAHGTMLLAERPLIRIPHNFVEGESAVFFDDLPELERKLAHYLSHSDDAARIAAAGRAHFLRYHTTSARARQFLGWIEQDTKS